MLHLWAHLSAAKVCREGADCVVSLQVRPKLQEEKVIDVLIPIMEGGISGHESSRVMAAESAMIVTRLTSKEDLMNLRVGKDVLSTIMHCLRCAIDGEQWANFAWRLGDVLEPLYRSKPPPRPSQSSTYPRPNTPSLFERKNRYEKPLFNRQAPGRAAQQDPLLRDVKGLCNTPNHSPWEGTKSS